MREGRGEGQEGCLWPLWFCEMSAGETLRGKGKVHQRLRHPFWATCSFRKALQDISHHGDQYADEKRPDTAKNDASELLTWHRI